jgi:hypothetical protein
MLRDKNFKFKYFDAKLRFAPFSFASLSHFKEIQFNNLLAIFPARVDPLKARSAASRQKFLEIHIRREATLHDFSFPTLAKLKSLIFKLKK